MKDILVDENDDLQIKSGDFVVGESNTQHERHLLQSEKGEFKAFPQIGVGIQNLLGEVNPRDVLVEIQRQFEADGIKVDEIKIVEGELDIKTKR